MMIAPENKIQWTPAAERSLDELVAYLGRWPHSDPEAQELEIEAAVESLRHAPSMCPILAIKRGRAFRRLVVSERFLVYYIYFQPRGGRNGVISVRAIRHGSRLDPFRGVREGPRQSWFVTLSSSQSC